MSADVFISFDTERGNMFHNKCLHTLEQIHSFIYLEKKKVKKRKAESLTGAAKALFLCNVFLSPNLEHGLHVSWGGPMLRFGTLGPKPG